MLTQRHLFNKPFLWMIPPRACERAKGGQGDREIHTSFESFKPFFFFTLDTKLMINLAAGLLVVKLLPLCQNSLTLSR